jgi:hypothetical protein
MRGQTSRLFDPVSVVGIIVDYQVKEPVIDQRPRAVHGLRPGTVMPDDQPVTGDPRHETGRRGRIHPILARRHHCRMRPLRRTPTDQVANQPQLRLIGPDTQPSKTLGDAIRDMHPQHAEVVDGPCQGLSRAGRERVVTASVRDFAVAGLVCPGPEPGVELKVAALFLAHDQRSQNCQGGRRPALVAPDAQTRSCVPS